MSLDGFVSWGLQYPPMNSLVGVSSGTVQTLFSHTDRFIVNVGKWDPPRTKSWKQLITNILIARFWWINWLPPDFVHQHYIDFYAYILQCLSLMDWLNYAQFRMIKVTGRNNRQQKPWVSCSISWIMDRRGFFGLRINPSLRRDKYGFHRDTTSLKFPWIVCMVGFNG